MLVLVKEGAFELVVKKSRFLAKVQSVTNQSEARESIKKQKALYRDATHVVHAFICGLSAEVMGSSDDGEPSGTAGKPVLDVLRGKGCTNVLVTVTRYFGGTLLGTGGLVKAYAESAKGALTDATFEPYVEKTAFAFSAPYALYDVLKMIMHDFGAEALSEAFGECVTVCGALTADMFTPFAARVFDASNGTVTVTKREV